jgi:thiamine kinase-like enzyme
MLDEIHALASRVPLLRGRIDAVTPLPGGLTNRNFRIDAAGQSYALRLPGAGTELLGIDRRRELACSRAAAAAGVGPEVVAHLPEQGALLTRFLPGRPLREEDVRRPDVLRRLARTLRCYHEHPVPADLGTFSPFETVRGYLALARERGVPLPAELDGALQALGAIEAELRSDEPACLCHNDLLSANFLDDGGAIRLVDWEYGGLGDRFFDLGNFAVNHQLDKFAERALLEAYWGEVRPDHVRRLRLMRLVSDMREAMWGFLQSAASTLHSPEYYLDYGRRHLGRFMSGCARPAAQRKNL